jgi:hypothetical protein
MRSFLRRRSGRRDKIDSEEKRTKILTWFNLAAVAAGTKAGVEEDEEEALQITRSRRTNGWLQRFTRRELTVRSISSILRGECK